MSASNQVCRYSSHIIKLISNRNLQIAAAAAVLAVFLQASAAFAAPLIDYTDTNLVNGVGGKESHIYPWGTGADQRRSTRSGMGYVVFTGNGQKLAAVSTVFGFTSKETGAPNVGGPENHKWFLRIEPITSADAATWYVEKFWNTSTGAYAASTVPGALDLSFTTPTTGNSPIVGTFLGINLRKVTVDASSANYTLAAGQLYRLVLIPWTQEPTPPGCTSANPACVTQLVALPGLSWAKSGGIGTMDSYYQTLLEYRSYGTTKYSTGTTQWYGGKLTPPGLVGPDGTVSPLPMEQTNWAYDIETDASPLGCTETGDWGINPFVVGRVTKAGAGYADYCTLRYNLVEQYCDTAGRRAQKAIRCPNGCVAGKCNESPL